MKSRLAIVDARCEKQIISRLHEYTEEVFLFRTEGITYESVSCHPDIFIFQESNHLIVAPNAPASLIETLTRLNIRFETGISNVGTQLSDSCFYNCIATTDHLFHRKGYTDESIQKYAQSKTFIPLPQSYTRCSMLALNEKCFITSDAGIDKQLRANGFETVLFSPNEIQIAVHKHGFLGGTCGRSDDKILFLGNPLLHQDGDKLCHFIEMNGLEVVSLCNSLLYDGGGIFFLP